MPNYAKGILFKITSAKGRHLGFLAGSVHDYLEQHLENIHPGQLAAVDTSTHVYTELLPSAAGTITHEHGPANSAQEEIYRQDRIIQGGFDTFMAVRAIKQGKQIFGLETTKTRNQAGEQSGLKKLEEEAKKNVNYERKKKLCASLLLVNPMLFALKQCQTALRSTPDVFFSHFSGLIQKTLAVIQLYDWLGLGSKVKLKGVLDQIDLVLEAGSTPVLTRFKMDGKSIIRLAYDGAVKKQGEHLRLEKQAEKEKIASIVNPWVAGNLGREQTITQASSSPLETAYNECLNLRDLVMADTLNRDLKVSENSKEKRLGFYIAGNRHLEGGYHQKSLLSLVEGYGWKLERVLLPDATESFTSIQGASILSSNGGAMTMMAGSIIYLVKMRVRGALLIKLRGSKPILDALIKKVRAPPEFTQKISREITGLFVW